MKRREFIGLVGAVAACPLRAQAQQDGRVRRIGWLYGGTESDAGGANQRMAFRESLAKLGWTEGRNLRIDLRFGGGDIGRIRSDATELVGLAPDVIVTSSGAATQAARQATQTIPIVFTVAGDAVANGLVTNIARPDGNVTGFSVAEPSVAGKYLGLLKEAAPQIKRVAVLINPELAATGPSYVAAIEAAAPALSVQITAIPYHDAIDLVRALDPFAAEPNGGLVVLPPTPTTANLAAILRLAEQHRLPAFFSGGSLIARVGGLLAYGTDLIDLNRRAAVYVDRFLRGAKVSDLPVQFPTKYEMFVNLKAAKAIGLSIPEAFLLRADELIE